MSERIGQVLREAVESGDAPGVVAMAATAAAGVVYEGAAGVRRLGEPAPMTLDTVFRVASMSKAVTSTAMMQLVERGQLSLDTPVTDVIPEFGRIQVLEGFDGDTPRLRAPSRPPTVRELASHTSGLAYEIWNGELLRYLEVTGSPGIMTAQRELLFTPMASDPGTRWEYSVGIDWLGQIVETLSGSDLEKYFQENIFGPLGMTETTFTPTAGQRERLAAIHVRLEDGSLAPTDIDWVGEPEREMYNGGHGLYSTTGDYMKFLGALLGGGAPIVSPATLEVMKANAIGDLEVQPLRAAIPTLSVDAAEFFPGMPKKHSTCFQITTAQAPGMRAAGSLSWAGIANSFYWWDPTTGVIGAICMQILPFCEPRALGVFENFEKAVYSSL